MKKKNVKKVVRRENYIYDNFILSMKYVRKSRVYFLAAIILILLSSLIGYFGVIELLSPLLEQNIDSYISKSVEELISQTENLGPVELTVFIISNNIKTAFFGIVSGIYFAISPIVIVIFNGYVLGFVAEKAANSPLNSSGIFVLWRLFPHGIFEIPAILISIGLGIKLGFYPFYLREKGKGFLSLFVSFALFVILSGVAMIILSLFIGGDVLSNKLMIEKETSLSIIMENPIISFVFYLLMALILIASMFIGMKVLTNKDRLIVEEIFRNSLLVFVFIIIPLLVIAGLIEGILIVLVG